MTYLLDHPNRHAPDRGDGRYWGYPTRQRPIRGVVVHTAEALDPHMADGDQTAERVARYFAGTDRPASAHVVVDADSKIVLLPDGHTAFHAKGCNADGLGIEIAYRAADWGTRPDRETALLAAAADVCADWARTHGIPIARHVTVDGWRAHGGLIAHAHVDPDRRTDPGPRFPWDTFLRMIRDRLDEEIPMGPKDIAYFQRALAVAAQDHDEPDFDPGEDDGVLGDDTAAAIRAWQTARSIDVTGTLTLATVSTLDRDWAKHRAGAGQVAPHSHSLDISATVT